MISYDRIFEGLKDELKYTTDWWKERLGPAAKRVGKELEYTKQYWKDKIQGAIGNKDENTEELKKKIAKYGQTLAKTNRENRELHEKVEQLQTAKGAAKVLGKHAADLAKEHPVATGIAGGLAALGLAKKLLNRKKKQNK